MPKRKFDPEDGPPEGEGKLRVTPDERTPPLADVKPQTLAYHQTKLRTTKDGKPATVTETELFDERCPVCVSEHREAIEQLYMRTKISVLESITKINREDLQLHFKATGLRRRRAEATEELAAHGLNAAYDNGVFDNLDGDQALRLLAEQNKMLGKTGGHDTGSARPQVLIITGVPMVPLPSRADVQRLSGTLVESSGLLPLPPIEVKKEE